MAENKAPMERFDAFIAVEDDHSRQVAMESVRPIIEDFERLLKGLKAVENNNGHINFNDHESRGRYVRIKYKDAPAFYGDTLGDVLTIALKVEEGRQ